MKIKKIIFGLGIWIIYVYLYDTFVLPACYVSNSNVKLMLANVNNLLLGIVASISILAVICGAVGYILSGFSARKEKEPIFKKVTCCGLVVLFFDILTYSLVVPVCVNF